MVPKMTPTTVQKRKRTKLYSGARQYVMLFFHRRAAVCTSAFCGYFFSNFKGSTPGAGLLSSSRFLNENSILGSERRWNVQLKLGVLQVLVLEHEGLHAGGRLAQLLDRLLEVPEQETESCQRENSIYSQIALKEVVFVNVFLLEGAPNKGGPGCSLLPVVLSSS
jgi:hypothetical protein